MPVAILFFCKESFVRVYAGAFIIFCVAHREEFLGEEQKVFYVFICYKHNTQTHTHTLTHAGKSYPQQNSTRKNKIKRKLLFSPVPGVSG